MNGHAESRVETYKADIRARLSAAHGSIPELAMSQRTLLTRQLHPSYLLQTVPS